MGKRLISQRRGKGTPRYRAPSHRYAGAVLYPARTSDPLRGEILDIISSVGHSAPLMVLKYEDEQMTLLPAPLGVRVGQEVFFGGKDAAIGNSLQLGDIPLGSTVFNVGLRPMENGKLFIRWW